MSHRKRPDRDALFALLYLDGLDPAAIAERFGTSQAQVRKWVMDTGLSARKVAITLARQRRVLEVGAAIAAQQPKPPITGVATNA